MTGASAVLAELRGRGARVHLLSGRVRIEAAKGLIPAPLIALAREHRDELLDVLHREAAADPALPNRLVLDRADRTAAQWRARFERLAAEQLFLEGYDRDDARRWAYLEVLVEWTLAHPDVDALPSCQAELVARMALSEMGIFDPRSGT
jgi:hypothetical protein